MTLVAEIPGTTVRVTFNPYQHFADGEYDYFKPEPKILTGDEVAHAERQETQAAELKDGELASVVADEKAIEVFDEDGRRQELLGVFCGEGNVFGTIIRTQLEGDDTPPQFVFSRLSVVASELEPDAPPVFQPVGVLYPGQTYRATEAYNEAGEYSVTDLMLAGDGSAVYVGHGGYGKTRIRVDDAASSDLRGLGWQWQLPTGDVDRLVADAATMHARFGTAGASPGN